MDKSLDELLKHLFGTNTDAFFRLELKEALTQLAKNNQRWKQSMQRHVKEWRKSSKRLPDADDSPRLQKTIIRDSFAYLELLAYAGAIEHQLDAETFLQLMHRDRYRAMMYHRVVAKAFVPWTADFTQRYVENMRHLHGLHPGLTYDPLIAYTAYAPAGDEKTARMKEFIETFDLNQSGHVVVRYFEELPDADFEREQEFLWGLVDHIPRADSRLLKVYRRLADFNPERALKVLFDIGSKRFAKGRHPPKWIYRAMLEIDAEHKLTTGLFEKTPEQHRDAMVEIKQRWLKEQANTP